MFTEKEKDKEQIEKFISIIHHDDKNSNYFICHYINGVMFSDRTILSEFDFNKIREEDCYISLNGFTGYKRKANTCRQINGILFDLDYHHKCTPEYLDWIKKRTLILIKEAVDAGRLYEANIISDTGRGLQLLYVFDKSISYRVKGGKKNETAIYAYERIRDNIKEKLMTILSEEPDTLEFDNNVFDLPRIVRIPGTFNTQAKTKACILHINEDYYSFSDFYTKKEKRYPQQKKPKEGKQYKTFSSKEALNEARLREMEKLQLIRKDHCEGYRNYMAFIYYNSAVQIFGQKEALAKTYTFCNNFGKSNSAFTESQIRAIARGIDKNSGKNFKGHYIIKKEWIIEKLNITDEEAELIGLDKTINARELKKRKNAALKEERNIRIIKMAEENIKHSEIAATVGVSLRTVQTVLKNYGKTRDYNANVNVQKNAS